MARQPRQFMRQGVGDLPDRASVNAYTGPRGEPIFDGETLRMHDGATPGGKRMLPDGGAGDVSAMSAKAIAPAPGVVTAARTSADRIRDRFTVKDAGAKATAGVDDWVPFQSPAQNLGVEQVTLPFKDKKGDPFKNWQPTRDKPGGNIHVPSGFYNLSQKVFTQPGVGWVLDGPVVWASRDANNNPILPDVLSVLGDGPANAVMSLASYAANTYDNTVLLIGQTQGYIQSRGDNVDGLYGQQQAILVRQTTQNPNDDTRGLVGMEIQQSFGPGEKTGAMWASHVLSYIAEGQTPYLCLGEWEVKNDSNHVQPKVGFKDTTIGLQLNNLGNTINTTAINCAVAGAGWRYGFTAFQGAVRHWCWAALNSEHNVVAGADMSGRINGREFALGTADGTATTGQDGSIVTSGAATFAKTDGAGGVALQATKLSLAGTPVDGSWTGYVPSLSAESGIITPVGGAGGYKVIGQTVHFRAAMTINNKGTASGSLYFGLPLRAKDHTTISAIEQVSFTGLAAYIQPNQTSAILKTLGGAFPLTGTGPWLVVISGTYEAA